SFSAASTDSFAPDKKTPAMLAGALIQKIWNGLGFQFAPQDPGKANQPRTQKSQAARLRNHDVGITTGDLCRAVEKALPSVDGQLHSRPENAASGIPGAAH